jgi:hypothetical protein
LPGASAVSQRLRATCSFSDDRDRQPFSIARERATNPICSARFFRAAGQFPSGWRQLQIFRIAAEPSSPVCRHDQCFVKMGRRRMPSIAGLETIISAGKASHFGKSSTGETANAAIRVRRFPGSFCSFLTRPAERYRETTDII